MTDEPHRLAALDRNETWPITPTMPSGSFGAPLGAIKQGRLVFASGITNLELNSSLPAAAIYTASFAGNPPSVRVQAGIITVQYRRAPADSVAAARPSPSRFALNPTVPWEIEFRAGVSRLAADLRGLSLCALDMSSVSMALIALPAPMTAANIYLSGSASNLVLQRPRGVAMSLHIAGAASYLMLDGQHIGASGGNFTWHSRSASDSAAHFDVAIAGSVSNLTVDFQE